jgi:hypothetical protein
VLKRFLSGDAIVGIKIKQPVEQVPHRIKALLRLYALLTLS